MAARPVQVSIDEDLLRRIDRDPETRQRGRSAFIRSAVQVYLKARSRRGVDAAIRRAFTGKADGMLDDVGSLIEAQAWPDE